MSVSEIGSEARMKLLTVVVLRCEKEVQMVCEWCGGDDDARGGVNKGIHEW